MIKLDEERRRSVPSYELSRIIGDSPTRFTIPHRVERRKNKTPLLCIYAGFMWVYSFSGSPLSFRTVGNFHEYTVHVLECCFTCS